jgi:DNA polymerase-3 subunit epsilon
MKKDLEKLAIEMEASPDYRVLRRLKWPPERSPSLLIEDRSKWKMGLYLDVETTGLDVDRSEIIEFGAVPFLFSVDGKIAAIEDSIHYYNQPSAPIPAAITTLTGITDEMVAGKKLDLRALAGIVSTTQLVIAHHAEFDRQMVERVVPEFKKVCWGCSMSQVPWESGRKLEYVLAGLGYFYDAHNAVSDCQAGVFALQSIVPGSTKPALAHVLEASRQQTWHVWAMSAAFSAKDALKARGYQWNGGDDGRLKAWHKEIKDDARTIEEEWLRATVYNRALVTPARFDKVTAFERFTRRG